MPRTSSPAGTVEHGQETVAGRTNLASTETAQLATHEGMVALEEVPPRSITVLSRKAGRPDDVGEQDRGQDPVGFVVPRVPRLRKRHRHSLAAES
jgi:hypothetical protein